jgi:diguanylate cyclase (GGDEF)-like protein/PAS domain S-box-containing protein
MAAREKSKVKPSEKSKEIKKRNGGKEVIDHKQVAEALKASEQNFRNSLDQSMNGIRISDNTGHTSYVNKAFLEIFDYKNIQEVMSTPPQEYYTPEAHADWVVRHEKLLRGEPMPKQIDVDIIRKDGIRKNLEVSMRQVFWDGKEQNQTLYHDITERKLVEHALKLSEQNFRNSMDSSAIGIRISDNKDHTSYANKALLEIFGYENIDEVKKSPPQEHYSPAAHASWVLRHEKLLRGEPMPKQVDIDIIRKDGTVRNLDVSMRDVFWDGKQQFQTLYNDITERKAAEAALHESEEKYRLIVENSSDIIFTLNAEGDFIYVSAAVKNVLGYDAADLTGRPFRSILHPDDIKTVQEAIKRNIMDGHQTPGGTEYRVRHISGEWRWHNGTGNTVRDSNGKFLYFIGMGRDITEMKRLTEETKRTNEKLNLMIKKLEEQQRQTTILTEMRDMLQACSKMEETAPIIMGSMKKLFPASQGALFLLSNSRSDLESVVTWGDFPTSSENNIFSPDACWGLRRGRAHVVEDVTVGPICPHLVHTTLSPYVCLPLMAKGDILGLLHLKNAFNANGSGGQEITDLKQMATTLSEYLSLSIANVKLSESLSRQSIQDPQTGLYNRRFMEESLQREITRAARKQTPIGIIMGDLDHFKKFNDVYGHAAGDKIIAQIGKLFNDKFRGSDIACRYGGEEFLVILPETSYEDTVKRAEALREEIKKLEMVFQGQILGIITMSMGVAVYPQNGVRMDELLRVADTALYKAKQEGRDRVISG